MSFPWAKQYEPSNGLTKFLDEKLPVPRLVYNAVGAGYPVPRNLNYMWNFGVLAGFFLVLQIVTGVVLAMHYAANASVAFATTSSLSGACYSPTSLRGERRNPRRPFGRGFDAAFAREIPSASS